MRTGHGADVWTAGERKESRSTKHSRAGTRVSETGCLRTWARWRRRIGSDSRREVTSVAASGIRQRRRRAGLAEGVSNGVSAAAEKHLSVPCGEESWSAVTLESGAAPKTTRHSARTGGESRCYRRTKAVCVDIGVAAATVCDGCADVDGG